LNILHKFLRDSLIMKLRDYEIYNIIGGNLYMPLPMVHLSTAIKVCEKLHVKPSPQLLLGALHQMQYI
jgi:hypothetical protein